VNGHALAASVFGELTPVTQHGHDLLDKLESRTRLFPYKVNRHSSAGPYHQPPDDVGIDGLDAMLDLIDPAWREHLTR
jgi:hypothetical protein